MELLSFKKTKKILKDYGIDLVASITVEKRGDLARAIKKVGFPAVMKAISPEVIHKTDQGLVKVGLNSRAEVEEAYVEIERIIKKKNIPVEEILLQKQGKGIELICGIKKDPTFGQTIVFGLGGIFTEIIKDISFGICPLKKSEAVLMIKKIKGYKILTGYRGAPSTDINRLADFLRAVCRLALENSKIEGIDFNPVFASGKKILVADAKIMVKKE